MQQIYERLTRGFSARAAGAGGPGRGGGGGDPAGGGPAGGGGGGRTGRNQLVTLVVSREVNKNYEIERSQLGHGLCGVVRRCWDGRTREVRFPNT